MNPRRPAVKFGSRTIAQSELNFFRRQLLWWAADSQRDFPWRRKTATLYQKIVSEVLLQRTQAHAVATFWPAFVKRFPTWTTIAQTPRDKIQSFLKPIGLSKQRAPRLRALAQEMTKRRGRFPRTRTEIEQLPGVGQYIASAVLMFQHHKPAPLLDVNMARVLERFFGPRKLADIRYDPYLQELSHEVVAHKRAVTLNWTILDFAALVCRSRNPRCAICPLRKKCRGQATNDSF